MNSEELVRQSKRSFANRFFIDPAVALCAVLFWGFFKILPIKWASYIGGVLGGFLGLLMKRRNHIGMVNLGFAFPEKTEQEKKEILNKMWRHWGRFYAEMPHARKLYQTADVYGLEYLISANQSGRGGFVCSAHLGNWELAVSGPLFDDFYLNPVYRKANNPWLEKLMFKRRTGTLIPKGANGARKIVEILHHKGFIVMLCDQKLREGISVPLFGKQAMTAPAIAVLAIKFKVPILMARSIRQPDGRFKVDISEPLPMPENVDIETATLQVMTTINQYYEKWIKETPEQWLWVHRRFDKSEYV